MFASLSARVAGIGDYMLRFLMPTFIGNVVGGTILAALLNHAPLAKELSDTAEEP